MVRNYHTVLIVKSVELIRARHILSMIYELEFKSPGWGSTILDAVSHYVSSCLEIPETELITYYMNKVPVVITFQTMYCIVNL